VLLGRSQRAALLLTFSPGGREVVELVRAPDDRAPGSSWRCAVLAKRESCRTPVIPGRGPGTGSRRRRRRRPVTLSLVITDWGGMSNDLDTSVTRTKRSRNGSLITRPGPFRALFDPSEAEHDRPRSYSVDDLDRWTSNERSGRSRLRFNDERDRGWRALRHLVVVSDWAISGAPAGEGTRRPSRALREPHSERQPSSRLFTQDSFHVVMLQALVRRAPRAIALSVFWAS